MNIQIIASIVFIVIGFTGLRQYIKIKNEEIQNEIKTGKINEPNYISLKARKRKGLIIGILFTGIGIIYLIKAFLKND